MSLRHQSWKLLLAIAAAVAVFLVVRPRTAMWAVATLVPAVGLGALIMCAKRESAGTIMLSVVWSLAGGLVGTAFSPVPPFHPPLEFLFYGIVCGWVLGGVFAHTEPLPRARGLPPKHPSLLWVSLALVPITHWLESYLLVPAKHVGIPTISVVVLGVFVRAVSIVPLAFYLYANRLAGREIQRSGLLLCVIVAIMLSVFTSELVSEVDPILWTTGTGVFVVE